MKKLKNLLLSPITNFTLLISHCRFHASIHPYLTKTVALVVVACFFVSSVCRDAVAVVSIPEVQASEYKQIFDDFTLPYSYGKITKSHFAGTDRVIINIQDLHCHPQVQKNISNIIELFDNKYAVSNVYLEGAYGNISTKWLTENIKNNNNKAEILNNILKTGKLTGAEYYSARSGKTEIIKGLEKKEPYLDNLKRFGDLLEKQDEIKLILNIVEQETEKIKKQHYKRAQIKLERLLKEYEQGKISSDKYYFLLSKYANKLGINLAKYKNVSDYITLLKLQKQFNRKTVQKELASLLSLLKQKLSYQEYSTLISKTDNFKKTDILSDCIMQMLQNNNINLDDNFSQLNKYFSFLKTNKNINPIQLLKEQEQLITKINTMLCENKLQKEVVFLVNFEKYLKQYLSTKITSADYEYYKENIEQYKMLYNKYIDNKVLTLLKPYMEETDKFYEINTNRNEYFAQNIFNGIQTKKLEKIAEGKDDINKIINNMPSTKRVDVIVTGGFHSQTVTEILEKQGVSYIVITPNVQGGVKEAEKTYYEIAEQQKEIDFQALATLPLSAYGSGNERYKIAVLIETCPKEAVELYGKDVVENIKNSNIEVKKEHIEKAKYYIEQLKEDINVSQILESDDIDIENLKNLVEQISSLVFNVEDLSDKELFEISKGVVNLLNNNDSNLAISFFNRLEYEIDVIFFRLFDVFQSDKKVRNNITDNIKNAMEKYLELVDYDFDVLCELFCYTSDMKKGKLKEFLNFEKNNKNKNFIEKNISLINEICLNYGDNDFEKVLNLILNEKHEEFVDNNSKVITEIVKQKYNLQDLQEIFKFFMEKNKEDMEFINKNIQLYSFSSDTSMALGWIISRGYDIKYLEKIIDKFLRKDSEGNYIYKNFLKEVSLSIHHYLSVYSSVSQEMLDILTDYYYLIDFDYDLKTDLFRALNDKLSKEEKTIIANKLLNILNKYCQTGELIDSQNDTLQIRRFLIENLPKEFCDLVLFELNKNQNKQLDKQTVGQISKISKFIIDNINLFEQIKLSEPAFDLLIETLGILNKQEFSNLENVDAKDEALHFLIANYKKLNKPQKEKFNKILTKYISDFTNLIENYDDKEISFHSHYVNFWSSAMYKGDKEEEKIEQERIEENYEKSLREDIKFILNNGDKLDSSVFGDNLIKIQNLLNMMEQYNDFERLNNKVKKMLVDGYIEYPVTLKEYSLNTSIETGIRNGKNPPLIRNKEFAKQRNCNTVKQVGKLFISFVMDEKNNNNKSNEIFKEKTGFSIEEIKDNFVYAKTIVKNKGAEIYERDYEKYEILEMYADDIVYAIVQIMKQQDDMQNKFDNENFNNFLKQNGIENNFKCPLFDGPCLVPYSKILNAGYDIGDCTGSLAGGLHNVDFRNNRIYTQNHLLYGYYKNGGLVQKYGCNYDDEDFHIFSLEEISGFRGDENSGGEYEFSDAERLYFFESMDFILEEKNRMEKENNIKEHTVYIETDTSNSQYLQHIARSITTEDYSNNDDLLSQGSPNTLNELNPNINFKDEINEAKTIAKRNKIIRTLTEYNYGIAVEDLKLDAEEELAKYGTDTVKAEYNKVKFDTSESITLDNFIKNFIKISKEYLSFYKTDKNTYVVPISENKVLEIKVNEQLKKTTIDTRFNKIDESEYTELLNQCVSLSQYEDEAISRQLNIHVIRSNIRAFIKKELKERSKEETNEYLSLLSDGAKVEDVKIIKSEEQEMLVLKIKDGKGNVYYAQTSVLTDIKQSLTFEVKDYDKNIVKNKISQYEKKTLLNKIASERLNLKPQFKNELTKSKTIEIDVPAYGVNYAYIEFLNGINNFINGIFSDKQQEKHKSQIMLTKQQLTPKLTSWAKQHNIKPVIINIKYEAVKTERDGNFLLQYRNNKIIRYKLQKDENGIEVVTIFSKKAITDNEVGLIMNVLQEEFFEAEIAELDWNDKEIMSNFEKKYNITDSNKEINDIVKDNLDIDENIKENTTQTDLIKNILSAA